MKESMTGRERIMAALRKEPVDRLPWIPNIVPYTVDSFPESMPHYAPDVIEYVGGDVMARFGKAIEVIPGLKEGTWVIPVSEYKDGDRISGYQTPVGTITRRDRSIGLGSMPGPVKFLLETVEDLKIFKYIMESVVYQIKPIYEQYFFENKAIGDRGVLTISAEFSPLQLLIEQLAGVEYTFYLLADAPDLFDEVMNMLHELNKTKIKALAESPAEVFIHYENTSSTVLSPRIYQKYCLPYLEEYTGIIHSYGKIHLIHACGKLEAFADLFRSEKYDGIVEITPPPVGDVELWEAKELFGDDKVVSGGIDCLTFTSGAPEQCYERAAEIIGKVKHYRGVLLGSGDSMPNGTTVENLQAVSRAVADLGFY